MNELVSLLNLSDAQENDIIGCGEASQLKSVYYLSYGMDAIRLTIYSLYDNDSGTWCLHVAPFELFNYDLKHGTDTLMAVYSVFTARLEPYLYRSKQGFCFNSIPGVAFKAFIQGLFILLQGSLVLLHDQFN